MWLAALGLLAVPGAHAADASLCQAGQTPLFTCAVGQKLVSVCSADGKATYDYGVPGKVEMSAQNLSLAQQMFSGGGETQIWFTHGTYSYVVYDETVRSSFSAGGHDDPDFTSGLVVLKSGKTISAKTCATDATISADASRVISPGRFIQH